MARFLMHKSRDYNGKSREVKHGRRKNIHSGRSK